MKTTCAVFLCAMLVLVSACAPKANDPADIQAIKKSVEDYAKAVNAGDADGVVAMMTDKTIYADNHSPVAVGKAAVRSMSAAFNSLFKVEFQAPVDEVRVVGDLAVARGTWAMKLTPKAEGLAPISDAGSWISTSTRQPDGSWKWDWVVPNSSQPMPGTTASGEDEQALFQLEQQWNAAGPTKDTAVVEKFLANEFVSNFDGRTQNKKQFLAEMKANAAKIDSAANSDMKAMVFGATAVVDGLYIEKSTTNGKDTSRRVRYTEVYVKRDGRWQCVIQYMTMVQ
jgi:uncharacterized protein (TIGR02246 family)